MQDGPTDEPPTQPDPTPGDPATSGVTGEESSGETADDPTDGRRPKGARAVVFAAPVVLLLAGLAIVLALRDEPAAAPAATVPSTTTTTSSTTTTTAVPVLPPGTVEVATVKPSVAVLEVRASEPPGWSEAPLSVRVEQGELPPSSAATAQPRAALPRPDHPIVGRRATAEGWRFDNPGPYEPAQPFTMLVVERRGEWLRVHLPVRPNDVQGWVRAQDVDVSTVRHRIEVRLGERRLRAFDGDQVIADTPVVIGAPDTPTPTGVFYVTDTVPQANPAGAYGPVALATDGYSEAMDVFSTGVPVIALHGTNRPELVGQAVANGCVRMPNDVIQSLAQQVPQGTPVFIWP